ncbi:MAG TPA: DUF6703 family protein [Mycobacteriales bacterium]|nr:DUF6703 family protein [Mycobacteriales bacterium]
MPRRLLILLAMLTVGGLFVAGLFVHGRLGGALLLVTDTILIVLTQTVWHEVNPRRRPVRVLIIATIAVVAVVKLILG